MKSREQQLIDLCFEFAIKAHRWHDPDITQFLDNEQIANWVSHNLRECGFDTQPMGLSWGVLKNVE